MIDKGWRKRLLGNRQLSPETLMMGYGYDPFLSERSLKPPVFHTSTFVFRTAQDGKEFFELAYGLRQKRPNEEPGLIYSRINNPDSGNSRGPAGDMGRGRGQPGVCVRHGRDLDLPVGLCAARHGDRSFGPRLRRHGFSLEQDPPAVRRHPCRFPRRRRNKGDGRSGRSGARSGLDRRALHRDAGQSDQRPRGYTQGAGNHRRSHRRRRQASGRHRRQHDARPSVSDADGAWRRSRRDLADKICRWPFRSHCGRMFGNGRGARADPRHAHDPGDDVRSSHRLAADAIARDAETQNDRFGRRRARGGEFSGRASRGRLGLAPWSRFPRIIRTARFTSASAKELGRPSVSKSKAARRKPSPCSIDFR